MGTTAPRSRARTERRWTWARYIQCCTTVATASSNAAFGVAFGMASTGPATGIGNGIATTPGGIAICVNHGRGVGQLQWRVSGGSRSSDLCVSSCK